MNQDEKKPLFASLDDNVNYLYEINSKDSDVVIKQFKIGDVRAALITCEGLSDKNLIGDTIMRPILSCDDIPQKPRAQYAYIRDRVLCASEQKEVFDFDELCTGFMGGSCALIIDAVPRALMLDVRGFDRRSISEPIMEITDRGSRESFIEVARINMTMIRRRLKTPSLRFETMEIGDESTTSIVLCYLADRASGSILEQVRKRLKSIKIDSVLESGYIQPFLDTKRLSFFSGVGYVERPDTLCAKLLEGRVGVIIDGAPLALVVPHLFSENFQSFDDYCNRPFYATFSRLLKYFSFFMSIILPGLYVAIGTFHPELLPESLLYDIAVSEARTPFSLAMEAFIIHIIYEILHQAGLRLPKPVGNTISVVGALVIGESAVTAGIISAPMVMVVAFTAISAFLVPTLYDASAVLRLLFILIGGFAGIFGVLIFLTVILINICSIDPYGIPYTSPFAPFDIRAMRDGIVRLGWQKLSRRVFKIQNSYGSEEKQKAGR
ncbi:MAG: spore germination protein [Clostridia bacterium]|nr:spore germination protein [Clostridia bacterium]